MCIVERLHGQYIIYNISMIITKNVDSKRDKYYLLINKLSFNGLKTISHS